MASITDKVGDLGGYLREQRQAARLSVRQLATLTGVSNPYLSQVERGLRRPSAEVLQQIAKGLRISAEALYVKAGILDSEGRPDVEAAIAADPQLTERQRRALLDIYLSFRSENRVEPPSGAEPDPEPVLTRQPAVKRAAVKKAAVTKAAVKKAAAKKSAAKKSAVTKSATTKSATQAAATGTARSVAQKTPRTTRRAGGGPSTEPAP